MSKYTDLRSGSFHSYAVKILEDEDRSMSVDEIFTKILEYKQSTSVRPRNSLVSVLLRSQHITRVGIGMYALKK
tara:strand:- start:276 stop:497 length:222 start_codon:yes stop_codon:yes gene_type:complete